MHMRDCCFRVRGCFEENIRDATIGHELCVHRHLDGSDVAVGTKDLA